MSDKNFEEAVDELVGFIDSAHAVNMALLKSNIKALYEASIRKVDPTETVRQILDTPIDLRSAIAGGIRPAQPAIHLQDEMMCTAENSVPLGEIGDLRDLSYVKVGTDTPLGKEFYHHCPEVQGKLVRLHSINHDYVHVCPICKQKYEQK